MPIAKPRKLVKEEIAAKSKGNGKRQNEDKGKGKGKGTPPQQQFKIMSTQEWQSP